MYLISLAILILILIIFYLEVLQKKEKPEEPKPKPLLSASVENYANAPAEITYDDVIKSKSLEDSVVDSHHQYVANTRQFSSGGNFSAVADDNNSDLFTNFLGFTRPYKVEILPGARQIPDVDSSVFARNKHLRFTNDQL